jgi:hypothetical protein
MTQAKSYNDITTHHITIHRFLQTRSIDFLTSDIHLGFSVNIDKRQIELRDEVYIFEDEKGVSVREYTPETWIVVFMVKGTDIVVGMSTVNVFDISGLKEVLARMLDGNQIQIIKRRHFFKVKSLLDEDMRNKRRVADERTDCVYNSEIIDIGFFPLKGNHHLEGCDVIQIQNEISTSGQLF